MPIYNYKCSSCNYSQDSISTLSERGTPRGCPSCGKITFNYRFEPSSGVGTKFDTNYHRDSSSDAVAWDHIIGESSNVAKDVLVEQRKKKASITQDGHFPVFNSNSGYRAALPVDVPQVLVNRAAKSDAGFKESVKNLKGDM